MVQLPILTFGFYNKLPDMKKNILLLLIVLLVSCDSTKKIKKGLSENDIYVSDKRVERKYFFPMFKMDVFLASLQYSFNDSPEIRKLLAQDKSNGGSGESLDPEDVIKVAKMIAARIERDSADNVTHAPGDLRGKTVFKTCIEFYYSKELDSIAQQLYKTKYSKPWILYPKSDTVKRH